MKKRLKICFDFDGTLNTKKGQELFYKLKELDVFDIYILTTRFDELHYHNYYAPRTINNADLYKLADVLNIPHRNIFFTNFKYKIDYLEKANVDLLIDDNKIELINLVVNYKKVKTKAISIRGSNVFQKIMRVLNIKKENNE